MWLYSHWFLSCASNLYLRNSAICWFMHAIPWQPFYWMHRAEGKSPAHLSDRASWEYLLLWHKTRPSSSSPLTVCRVVYWPWCIAKHLCGRLSLSSSSFHWLALPSGQKLQFHQLVSIPSSVDKQVFLIRPLRSSTPPPFRQQPLVLDRFLNLFLEICDRCRDISIITYL